MSIYKSITRRIIKYFFRGLILTLVLTITLVLPWRWITPPTSAFMFKEYWTTERKPAYKWVPLEKVSPYMGLAVVAAEDQKFPDHYGFDFESITDAFIKQRHKRRGASTISQQVAKNLFLWSGHSYLRKGIEAYLTIAIETLWPKRRILEVYINIAEFGPGVYGVGAASRRLRHKPAARLTPYDCAILAAVLPNPKRMSAARPSAYVRKRAWEILAQIRSLGGTNYLKHI